MSSQTSLDVVEPFGLSKLRSQCKGDTDLMYTLCENYANDFETRLRHAEQALKHENPIVFVQHAKHFQKDCDTLDVDFGAVIEEPVQIPTKITQGMKQWLKDMKTNTSAFSKYILDMKLQSTRGKRPNEKEHEKGEMLV